MFIARDRVSRFFPYGHDVKCTKTLFGWYAFWRDLFTAPPDYISSVYLRKNANDATGMDPCLHRAFYARS